MPPPYGRIVEFLALTGQRREEVAQLTWEEIDEKARTWTIPGSRTKNKKAHIVHLSTPAWKVIQACSGEPYVFGTAKGNRFQRFGKEKRVIDKLCGITGWRLHDLRRTIVSGMARLGIPPHVADKILNHQAGTISGVAAVYQRHDFLADREAALDRWGVHVEHVVQKFRASKDEQPSIAAANKIGLADTGGVMKTRETKTGLTLALTLYAKAADRSRLFIEGMSSLGVINKFYCRTSICATLLKTEK